MPACVIGSAQRRGKTLTSRVYPSISTPMNRPEPKMTHGTLTAPRLAISFERVSGWMMLYAVMAR